MSIKEDTRESELSNECICSGWKKAKYMNLIISPFVKPYKTSISFGPDSKSVEASKILSALGLSDNSVVRFLMTVNSLAVITSPGSYDFFETLKYHLIDLEEHLGKPLIVRIDHYPGKGNRLSDDLQYLATFRPNREIIMGDDGFKRTRYLI